MAFSLALASQTGAAVLRVNFAGSMPLSASPLGAHDARNISNWSLLGPSEATVAEVRLVPSDPFSFDLICSTMLAAGLWILGAGDIRTPTGTALDGTQLGFQSVGAQPFFSVPAEQITSETVLRQALNAALDGPGWRAWTAALGYSDEKVAQAGQSAFKQRLLATASGEYLERLTTASGVDRPPNVRIDDEALRKLTIALNNDKVNATGLEAILLAYYGLDATVAHGQTAVSEPFVLADQETLFFTVDGQDVEVVFSTADFTHIGAATAAEAAAVINRRLWLQGLRAFADASTDVQTGLVYLRVYSGLNGIKGRLEFTGGSADKALRFPTIVNTTQDIGTTWDITPSSSMNAVPVNRVRLTWTGGTDPGLSAVQAGDYANIYGSPFTAVNRGTFKVVATTPTYVEYEGADFATSQSGAVQVTSEDLYFSRPTVIGLNGKYVAAVVNPDFDTSEILLPTTAAAVTRDEQLGWYLNGLQPIAIDGTYSTSGRPAGSTTVSLKTVVPHGLVTGNFFFLDSVQIDYASSLGATQLTLGVPPTGNLYAAVKLDDGRLMAIFKTGSSTTTVNAFFFDPVANTWSVGAPTTLSGTAFNQPTLVKLNGGRVLMLGASQYAIYDPLGNVWTSPSSGPESLNVPWHSIVKLNDGRVLAAYMNAALTSLNSSIYDPLANSWSSPVVIDGTAGGYTLHGATLIENRGDVVLCGGYNGLLASAKAYYYNVVANTWKAIANMPTGLMFPKGLYVPKGPAGQLWFVSKDVGGTAHFNILDVTSLSWTTRALGQVSTRTSSTTVYRNSQVFWIPDINTLSWELHDPQQPAATGIRVLSGTTGLLSPSALDNLPFAFLLDDQRIVAVDQEDSTASGTTVAYMSYALARTRSGGQLAGGPFKVTATPASNILQFVTPETDAYTKVTAGLLTPIDAELGTLNSGHILNTKDGVALADGQTNLTAAILKGFAPNLIEVTSSAQFPDEPGYLVLAFAEGRQSRPLRYLGIASGTQIRVDPNERLDFEYGIGTTVNLLVGAGVFSPNSSIELGVTWLTDSSIGRVEAQKQLDASVGVGANVIDRVLYPGDRGLGNEGLPNHGVAKISDVVTIWGSNDYLNEAAAARLEVK